MASLLDITNTARTVPIQGQDVAVYGLSGEAIAALMVRFPEIGKALAAGGSSALSREALGKMAPELIGAILAAGTGHVGERNHEEAARRLAVGDQAELFDEVLRLTFPRGLGPLLEKLTGLAASVGVNLNAADLSRTLSQEASQNSSAKDTDTKPSGE
jgi:hypothetical protein